MLQGSTRPPCETAKLNVNAVHSSLYIPPSVTYTV